MLEPSIKVPMIATGPGIIRDHVSDQMISGVDLFPTIVEGAGIRLEPEDQDLPGISLWPALTGRDQDRVGFVEFHASASRHGSFVWRDGKYKFVYHVNMPNQLFDLETDPNEVFEWDATEFDSTLEELQITIRVDWPLSRNAHELNKAKRQMNPEKHAETSVQSQNQHAMMFLSL